MHFVEFAAKIDLLRYFAIFALALFINIVFFQRFAFNRYDPLWIIVMTFTFQLATPLYILLIERNIETQHVVYIALGLFAFWLGMLVTQLLLRIRRRSGLQPYNLHPFSYNRLRYQRESRFIYIFLTCTTVLITLVLLLRTATVGLPILSANPEAEKLLVNQGGFGILERLIEPSVNCSLIFFFYLTARQRKLTVKLIIYMIMPIMALLASGSKGIFLSAYYTFYFTNVYLIYPTGKPFTFVSWKAVFGAGIVVFLYATLILYVRAANTESTNILLSIVQSLTARLIAFSDGIYYFFSGNGLSHQIQYQPLEYFYHYWIIPLFAPLRLVAYLPQTLGNELISTKLGGTWVGGPNPTMTVEGFVYFGYFGGIIYCFLLGVFFMFCRGIMLKVTHKIGLRILLLFCICNLLSMSLTSDTLLFVASLLNYSTIGIFIFIVGSLLYTIQKYAHLLVVRAQPQTYLDQ